MPATAAIPGSKTIRKSVKPSPASVTASSAKTHLLQLLDAVDLRRESVVITKRGRAVARLVPIETEQSTGLFGCMKGTIRITGDIISPEPDVWDAMVE